MLRHLRRWRATVVSRRLTPRVVNRRRRRPPSLVTAHNAARSKHHPPPQARAGAQSSLKKLLDTKEKNEPVRVALLCLRTAKRRAGRHLRPTPQSSTAHFCILSSHQTHGSLRCSRAQHKSLAKNAQRKKLRRHGAATRQAQQTIKSTAGRHKAAAAHTMHPQIKGGSTLSQPFGQKEHTPRGEQIFLCRTRRVAERRRQPAATLARRRGAETPQQRARHAKIPADRAQQRRGTREPHAPRRTTIANTPTTRKTSQATSMLQELGI